MAKALRKAGKKYDGDDQNGTSGPSGSEPVLKPSARKKPIRSKVHKPKESLEDLIEKMNLPVFSILVNWRDTTIPESVPDSVLPWSEEIQSRFSLTGQAA